jgi:hypothetical protein
MRNLIAAALIAGIAAPAWAADCPAPAAWAKPERHIAARSPAMKFALKPGTSSQIGLLPQQQVKFAVGKVTRKGFAGLAAIDVAKAGTLRLLVSNRTYVDLVRDGKALDLTGEPAHPDCPGVRKALDFTVKPGRYLVQLSGSEDRTIKLATIQR